MKYKIQSIKSAEEFGRAKVAIELGITENTMYAWTKAVIEERLDIGSGSHTPETAMSLAEELAVLRNQWNHLFMQAIIYMGTIWGKKYEKVYISNFLCGNCSDMYRLYL